MSSSAARGRREVQNYLPLGSDAVSVVDRTGNGLGRPIDRWAEVGGSTDCQPDQGCSNESAI